MKRSLKRCGVSAACLLAIVAGYAAPAASEGQSTAAAIISALFKSGRGQPADLSGASLSGLDLAGVDFKGAAMVSSDLFGADLAGANLRDANLEGAKLDRAILTAADFSGANLGRATVLNPTIFTGIEQYRREAPRFVGANLRGAELSGAFDWADFSNSDLEGAAFGPRNDRDETQFARRASLTGANFTGAKLKSLRLVGVTMKYAKFRAADVSGVDFRKANLMLADFTGADVTGANFTGADLDEAIFKDAKGLDRAIGVNDAHNADRIVRQ